MLLAMAPLFRPLEEISISGYKSFKHLDQLRIARDLNILIGPNGAGKTNFIRFFELLGHMMDTNKGLQNYLSARGRADAFLFQGMKVTRELTAHLKFGHNEYNFTLRGADNRSMFFAHESAPFHGGLGLTKNDQGQGHLESHLLEEDENDSKSIQWVRETLRGWRVYHFHDTSSSAGVMGLSNIVDNEMLHNDAANLAAFMMRLETEYPKHFAQIKETVRQVAPSFGTFVLKEVSGGQTQLLWKDRYSDLIYYPHQLSDGTLRYICLCALLLQPNPPSTIIIDEPELGLHPQAIKLLASLIHEAAEHAQLIVSTQSSMLLDEFEPEHVIVADYEDGQTTLTRLDAERLKSWLEEYTLGQLWEKNELGGQP